jgi:hypothetical protein
MMSSLQFTSQRFSGPRDFLAANADALLETRALSANLPLNGAYKAVTEGLAVDPNHIWLAVYTTLPDGRHLVFGCIVGGLPLAALVSSIDPNRLGEDVLASGMDALAATLDETDAPTSRFATALGPRSLVEPFVRSFSAQRALTVSNKLHFHMYLSAVTPRTLKAATRVIDGLDIFLGEQSDVEAVARMWHALSALGPHPSPLEYARTQARQHIGEGCLWVGMHDGRVACFVASSRPTPGMRAISSVYTDERARGKGIAEAVIREACKT